MDPQIPEIEDVPSILLPCSSCTRTFRPEALAKHTKVCEKSLMKKRKTFDSSKQRLQGTEVESFSPGPDTGSLRRGRGKERAEPVKVVQTTKERVSRTQVGKRPDLQSQVRPSDHTECPFCGRSFGPKSFERHMEFCKEQHLKLKSTPSNREAKERLKVRTSYKGPLTHKVLTRDRYQPKRDPSPINIELKDVGSIGKGLRRNASLRSSLRSTRGSNSVSPPPLRRTMTQINPSPEMRKVKKENVNESTRQTNGNQNQGVPRMINKDPPDRKVKNQSLNSVSFPKIPVFKKEANNKNNIKYIQKPCGKREKDQETSGIVNVTDIKENYSSRPSLFDKNDNTVLEMDTSASEEVSSPGYMASCTPKKLLPVPHGLKRSKTVSLIKHNKKSTPNCQSEDSTETNGTGKNCFLLPNIVCIQNLDQDILGATSDSYTQNSKISQLMTDLTENIESQLSTSKNLNFYETIDVNLLLYPMDFSSNVLDSSKQHNIDRKCGLQKSIDTVLNSSYKESIAREDNSLNDDFSEHEEFKKNQVNYLEKCSNSTINEPVVKIEPMTFKLGSSTNFKTTENETKLNIYKKNDDTHNGNLALNKNVGFQLPKSHNTNTMEYEHSINQKSLTKSHKLENSQVLPIIQSFGSLIKSNTMDSPKIIEDTINSQPLTGDLSLADLQFLENKFLTSSPPEEYYIEEPKTYLKTLYYDPLKISNLKSGKVLIPLACDTQGQSVTNPEFKKNNFYTPLQNSLIYNLSSTPEYTNDRTVASEVVKEPVINEILSSQSIDFLKDNCGLGMTQTFDLPIIPFNHHWTSNYSSESKKNLETEVVQIKKTEKEKNIHHTGNNMKFRDDSLMIENNNILYGVTNFKTNLNSIEYSIKRKNDISKGNDCLNIHNTFGRISENTESQREIKKRSTSFIRNHLIDTSTNLGDQGNTLQAHFQTESNTNIFTNKLCSLNNESEKNSVLSLRNDFSDTSKNIENAYKDLPYLKHNPSPIPYSISEVIKQKKKHNSGNKENYSNCSSQSINSKLDVSRLYSRKEIIKKSNISKTYPLLEVITINTGNSEIFGNTIDVIYSNRDKPQELKQTISRETCSVEELSRTSYAYQKLGSMYKESVNSKTCSILTPEISTKCNELVNSETQPPFIPSEISTKYNELANSESRPVLIPEISAKYNELVNSKTLLTLTPSEIRSNCNKFVTSETCPTLASSELSTKYNELVNSETCPTLASSEISIKYNELGNSETRSTLTPSEIKSNCNEFVTSEICPTLASSEISIKYNELVNSETRSTLTPSKIKSNCNEFVTSETCPTLLPSELSTKYNELVNSETYPKVTPSEIGTKFNRLVNPETVSTFTPSEMKSKCNELVVSESCPTSAPYVNSECNGLINSETCHTSQPPEIIINDGISGNCVTYPTLETSDISMQLVHPQVLTEYNNSKYSPEMLSNFNDPSFKIYKFDACCNELYYPEVQLSDNSEMVGATLDQQTVSTDITTSSLEHRTSKHYKTLMNNGHRNIHTSMLNCPTYSAEKRLKLSDPLSLNLGCSLTKTISVPKFGNQDHFVCQNVLKDYPIDELTICTENKLKFCKSEFIPNVNLTKSPEWHKTNSHFSTAVPSSHLESFAQRCTNDLDTISEDSLERLSLDPSNTSENFPSDSESVFSDSAIDSSCKSPILFWNNQKLCNPKLDYNDIGGLDSNYFCHRINGIDDSQKKKGRIKVDCRTNINTVNGNVPSNYSFRSNSKLSDKNNVTSDKSHCVYPRPVCQEISKTTNTVSMKTECSSIGHIGEMLYKNSERMEEKPCLMGVSECSSDSESSCMSDSAVYIKQCSKTVEYFQEGEDYHTVETSVYNFPKLEDNFGKMKHLPPRFTSFPNPCSLANKATIQGTFDVEGNILKLPPIKKSERSPVCCNTQLPTRNTVLTSFLPLDVRTIASKSYESTSNPQYSDVILRGPDNVSEQNRICTPSSTNSSKYFDAIKTPAISAEEKLSFKRSSGLHHESFSKMKKIQPTHEQLNNRDKFLGFSHFKNSTMNDIRRVDNLHPQFSDPPRKTTSGVPFPTSIESCEDKHYPELLQRKLLSIFHSAHGTGEGENYNPYLSAERQMMELFGGEGKRSPGSVRSPLQSSPSSAFVKYRSSSSESLKEGAEERVVLVAAEEEEEETSPRKPEPLLGLRKPDPLGLSSLSLCSVVSIDSVDCNHNGGVEQSLPEGGKAARAGRVKVDMREMLYGGGEPPLPPQPDLQACEAELLLSMLEFEKMLKSSPIPSPQSSPTLCSSTPPDNDSNQNNNMTENHNNLKNLNQGSVDSAYSSLTRWSGGDGERNQPSFCHECGAKYPVSAAKFCCNCGIKRIALS